MSDKPDSEPTGATAVRRGRPSLLYRLGQNLIDVLLWSIGILGLLSLTAAIIAHIWGLSIILFSTGSMSPTIPAGSAALVQRIAASEVAVGDVVTVERKDALPITHRVTSIRPSDTVAGGYVITMKGDANLSEDAAPYQVSEVRRVLYSVPGVAQTIARLRSPYVIGGLTVVAALLVTWAFWPRRPSGPARVADDGDADGADGPASDDAVEGAESA
ncbi:MAG: signal peptidase I [Propionibacteriales bacterium]|nr:signal peptidase I [Propionibacteriales bacterium]